MFSAAFGGGGGGVVVTSVVCIGNVGGAAVVFVGNVGGASVVFVGNVGGASVVSVNSVGSGSSFLLSSRWFRGRQRLTRPLVSRRCRLGPAFGLLPSNGFNIIRFFFRMFNTACWLVSRQLVCQLDLDMVKTFTDPP